MMACLRIWGSGVFTGSRDLSFLLLTSVFALLISRASLLVSICNVFLVIGEQMCWGTITEGSDISSSELDVRYEMVTSGC